jgi:uncharacterized membrane protein
MTTTWIRRVAVLALLVLLVGAQPAQARSFEILSMEVIARVNPDGSMDVVERLNYDFDGDFNGGTRQIPDGDYDIVGFQVTEGGEHRDFPPGGDDPTFGDGARWFGSADHSQVTGRHSYDLSYRVIDAVDVHADVGELNWFFVGNDFPQMDSVQIDITMPGDGTDMRAFAHGDLSGIVSLEANTVHLGVTGNPASSPIEARVVVPTAAFTGVVPSPEPGLDAILAEEASLAGQANAARDRATADYAELVGLGLPSGCTDESSSGLDASCERLQGLLDEAGDPTNGEPLGADDAERYFAIIQARRDIDDEVDRIVTDRQAGQATVAVPAAAAVAVVGWYVLFRKVGKEHEKPADIGDYWREIPDQPPAIIAAVDDWGVVGNDAFATTVLDLAQRGWLTITEEGGGHRFTRTQQTEDEMPLRSFESKALWKLFENGRPTVTQDELVDEAKASRTSSSSWMSGFKSQIQNEYNQQQYQEKKGCLPYVLHFGLVGLLALLAVGALVFGSLVGFGVAGAAALVLLPLGGLLRRKTEKGARKKAEVAGLKRFLKDFSLVDDVPVGHLALYERYLVYAVALGVADKLIAGLRMRFPELANTNTGFAPWYIGSSIGHGSAGGFDSLASIGSVGDFAHDFSKATASAFSPPASSGGSGGGFSGGSSGGGFSGGGGGGGAGAW